jgi:hypothetical protein
LWDLLKLLGPLKTAGLPLGESQDTSDLPKEIPVLFVKVLPSLFDLNQLDLSLFEPYNWIGKDVV